MKKVKWIAVDKKLPEEIEFPHEQKLWLLTENYGTMSGMFHKNKFMKNYACEILNVTHWLILPNGSDVI